MNKDVVMSKEAFQALKTALQEQYDTKSVILACDICETLRTWVKHVEEE